MTAERAGRESRVRRGLVLLVLVLLAVTLVWWIAGRATADARRLAVRSWAAPAALPPAADTSTEITVLAWNVAHGRGDVGLGLLRNFRGGDDEERMARLARIAGVLRRVDADIVVLNEVDFRATWSGGVNQAEVLARAAGYRTWVQQSNYDIRLPFAVFWFGNAVLTRLPVDEVRWLEIPPHSRLEALVAGAKSASVVRLRTGAGPVSLVPIHLERRSGETRRAAVPALEALRSREEAPLILAGDFNASPPGWPGAAARTVIGELLDRGWRSPLATGAPGAAGLTYPTYELREAIDWILVEPRLRVVDARVIEGTAELSDHAPVFAVLRLRDGAGVEDGVGLGDGAGGRTLAFLPGQCPGTAASRPARHNPTAFPSERPIPSAALSPRRSDRSHDRNGGRSIRPLRLPPR